MSSDAELIEQCLELIAEKTDDIAPRVYQLFFSARPDAEELFGHDAGDIVKGHMIVSLMLEIMNFSEGVIYSDNVRRWINDHEAYGVTFDMYPVMYDCLLIAIKELIGTSWTDEMEAVWRRQFDKLHVFLEEVYQ